MWIYYVIVFVVLFWTLAMAVREGLWHNLMLACNITLASVIAFGFYQPLTILIDEASGGQYTYLLDLVVFWLLFVLAIALLKELGKLLSPTQVKFLHPVNKFGGPAMALVCAIMMTCITAASLHMAPLPLETMGGALADADVPDEPLPLNPSADIAFLGAANLFTTQAGLGDGGLFSAPQWVEDYADRRKRWEEVRKSAGSAFAMRVTRRSDRDDLP